MSVEVLVNNDNCNTPNWTQYSTKTVWQLYNQSEINKKYDSVYVKKNKFHSINARNFTYVNNSCKTSKMKPRVRTRLYRLIVFQETRILI